jgi:hypothetical protein
MSRSPVRFSLVLPTYHNHDYDGVVNAELAAEARQPTHDTQAEKEEGSGAGGDASGGEDAALIPDGVITYGRRDILGGFASQSVVELAARGNPRL